MKNKKPKRIEVSVTGKCDYCDEPMKHMGATPSLKVHRACDKHLKKAQLAIKKEMKNEDNQAKS